MIVWVGSGTKSLKAPGRPTCFEANIEVLEEKKQKKK